MSTIAPLSAIHEFITDRGITKSAADTLREHSDKVTIVDVGDTVSTNLREPMRRV